MSGARCGCEEERMIMEAERGVAISLFFLFSRDEEIMLSSSRENESCFTVLFFFS